MKHKKESWLKTLESTKHLIKVAWDMLEALKAIVEACDEPTPHIPKIKHIAQNIIAKAEGN